MAEGCGGGDSTTPSRDLLGDPPVTCANADLSALRKTVFVSTAGSDSPTCGSGAAGACRSVQQGIANCTETACGVLVGQGTYELDAAAAGLPRNVVLRQGVNVFGGCMLGGSTESRYRSTLRGPAGLPAVSASAITGATLMHGFVVIAGSSRRYMPTTSGGAGGRRLGYVPDRDLPELYAGAAAFAMPSLYEGFGLPCVEAMAAGTPVVAAERGALPEACGGAALLADPADPDAFAAALLRAAGPERDRLVTAGRERAAGLTWQRTAEAVDRALEPLLATGRRR